MLIHTFLATRFLRRFSTTLSHALSSSATHAASPIETKYKELVQIGAIRHDDTQYSVVKRLQRLFDELHVYVNAMRQWSLAVDEYQAKLNSKIAKLAMAETASSEHAEREPTLKPSSSSWSLTSWLLKGNHDPRNELNPDQKERLRKMDRELRALRELGPSPSPPAPPKGIYLHGSVGSGKTKMMDLFFDSIRSSNIADALTGGHKRVHFNQAMLSIHSRIHETEKMKLRNPSATQEEEEEEEEEEEVDAAHNRSGIFRYWGDLNERNKASKLAFLSIRKHLRLARSCKISKISLAKANSQQLSSVAKSFLLQSNTELASQQAQASLLAFDEVQITDPFTAATLKALFEGLIASGCVFVMTSNRAPRELPRHGLHEDMFESLIQTIEDQTDVMDLSSMDYRRASVSDRGGNSSDQIAQTYFYPLTDKASNEAFEREWKVLAPSPSPLTIPVLFGRTLLVPQAQNGAARFDFEELCAKPLGPADYVAVATHFHCVFLDGVPVFSMNIKDQARRFITLVDELYNAKTRLFIRAAAEPDQLFKGETKDRHGPSESVVDLEGLQFEGAAEGGRLRRNVLGEGGVAPVASTDKERIAAQAHLGGNEERFAFARAISRLYEMTSCPECV